MKVPPESKVMTELRAIRDDIYRDARKMGIEQYYDALNRRAGFFPGELPPRRKSLSARQRANKRAECVAKLSQPTAVEEIRSIRSKGHQHEDEQSLILKEGSKKDYGKK